MSGPPRALRRSLRRAEFLRATRKGRRVDTEYFRVFLVDRSDGSGARLGITVTRKVGNAVRRNRIKRLVREWFRHRDHELGSCDLIVIVKRDVPPAPTLRGICQDLDRVLGTRRVGS